MGLLYHWQSYRSTGFYTWSRLTILQALSHVMNKHANQLRDERVSSRAGSPKLICGVVKLYLPAFNDYTKTDIHLELYHFQFIPILHHIIDNDISGSRPGQSVQIILFLFVSEIRLCACALCVYFLRQNISLAHSKNIADMVKWHISISTDEKKIKTLDS